MDKPIIELWWCPMCGRCDSKDSAIKEKCPCGYPWRTIRKFENGGFFKPLPEA